MHGAVGDGLDLGGVGDVGDDRGGRAARLLDLVDQRAQPGLAAGGDHDRGALLGEPQRGGAADAAGGAHHDDDLLGDGFERYVLERHGKILCSTGEPGTGMASGGRHAGSRSAVTEPDRRPLVRLPRRWTASTSRRMASGVSDWGAWPAPYSGTNRAPGNRRQVAGGLPDGDQVGGALGEHDRAVDPVEPGRDVGEDAPPQHLPEGVRVGEPLPQGAGLGLAGPPRRRAQPGEQQRSGRGSCGRPRYERAQAAQGQPVGGSSAAPWWSRSPRGVQTRRGRSPRPNGPGRGRPVPARRGHRWSCPARAPGRRPARPGRRRPRRRSPRSSAGGRARGSGRARAGRGPAPGTRASSRGRSATKSSWVLPMPCSRSRGSPDPAQSQES